jgi:peptide/nickel transport system ATP-binding protein
VVALIEVSGLVCEYPQGRESLFGKRRALRAVDGVDLAIAPGECVAVVGESGSGKSTLARAMLALEVAVEGDVRLRGRSLFAMDAAELRRARGDLKMVFQDPYDSLDPRMRVGTSVGDPIRALGRRPDRAAFRAQVGEALESVGLRASDMDKYPHEFSGGQRQRIAIARAIITRPALIVADEPVSALDVSVQAQILNLLRDLRRELETAFVLISHNLAVVRHVADRVAVMKDGVVVEQQPTRHIFEHPQHDYTRKLLAAMLKPMARRRAAPSEADRR